jgi:hypothetical protein
MEVACTMCLTNLHQGDFRNLQEKIVGETRVTGTNRWHFEAKGETCLNLSAAGVYIDLLGPLQGGQAGCMTTHAQCC